MKDLKERTEAKKVYIGEWLKYKAEHPEMPLREQFSGLHGKREYRAAKNAWIKTIVDLAEYVARRFLTLLDKGQIEMAGLYSQYYPDFLKKGYDLHA